MLFYEILGVLLGGRNQPQPPRTLPFAAQAGLLQQIALAHHADGLAVAEEEGDPDGLNYLAGTRYGYINEQAYKATAEAHAEGGVPNWTLTLPRLDAESVGRLLSFYMHSVAVSGTMLGVDPFNQPGVETYKQKMFSLLGKPSG